MDSPLFTVVIPTLNRADVLAAAIKTCVQQDDPALEILISDNASNDDTRAVVESIADSRVRYVNPGQPLGMPEHWDFALAHVSPGYVTVLGDDDGLLPGAIGHARAILSKSGQRVLTWRKAEYHWPDHIVPSYRNWLQIPFGESIENFESARVLRDVLAFRRTYTDLPCIYNSFVATEILESIREQSSGRVVPCIAPDLYSGIAVACIVDDYLFSMRPLSVNGASRHSNGTIASVRGAGDTGALRHFTSSGVEIDSRLVRCTSVPVVIVDAAMVAGTHFLRANDWPAIDWVGMLTSSARAAEGQPLAVFTETIAALDEIARRNGLTEVWKQIRSTLAHRGMPGLQRPGWDATGTTFVVDGAVLGLRDVADAASATATILAAVPTTSARTHLRWSDASDHVPTGTPPGMVAAWARTLLWANRRPSQKPSTLRRLWRRIRRRMKGMRPLDLGQTNLGDANGD